MIRIAALALLGLWAGHNQEQQSVAFEVASVKPVEFNRQAPMCMCEQNATLAYRQASLRNIIRRAYGLQDLQLLGPDWLDAERFNIDAKSPAGASKDQVPEMLQALLAERFKLEAHTNTKWLSGFMLVLGKDGSKLTPVRTGGPFQTPIDRTGRHTSGTMTMVILAGLLSADLQRPVLDKTGLEGLYKVKLDYAMDSPLGTGTGANDAVPAPSLSTALQDQAGLKIEPTKVQVKILVIDHIEKVPTEN